MKIDRLIGIVTILLQTEKSTVPALAQRFEVSRRTIERDIDALCRAGVPLVTVQGYGGGVFIEPRYKLDKTLLSGPELAALVAGAAGVGSVSPAPLARSLAEKLGGSGTDDLLIDLSSHYRESAGQVTPRQLELPEPPVNADFVKDITQAVLYQPNRLFVSLK